MIDEFALDDEPVIQTRDLLIQAAHLGLVTALVLGKNAAGEAAVVGTEDLHDWNKVRELLAEMLKRVDMAILEETDFAPGTKAN